MSGPSLVTQPVDRFGRTAAGMTVAGGLLIAALAVEAAGGPDLGAVWFAVAAVDLAAWPLGLVVLYGTVPRVVAPAGSRWWRRSSRSWYSRSRT